MKKRMIIFAIINLVVFFAFALTLLITNYVLKVKSETPVYSIVRPTNLDSYGKEVELNEIGLQRIEVDLNGADYWEDAIETGVQLSKRWVDTNKRLTTMIGGQYDFTFINETGRAITKWRYFIGVPSEHYLDSYWDGTFIDNPTTMIIEPLDYNTRVESGSSRVFGFILLTGEHSITFENVCFEFYLEYILRDNIVYKIAMVCLLLFVVFDMIFITANVYAYQYQKKAEQEHRVFIQSLKAFATIIDAKDEYTKGHSLRVAAYAKELAKRIGFSEEDQQRVYYAGVLHDIGKIGVPDSILMKPGALTEEERNVIKNHVNVGGEILKDFVSVKGITEGAKYHHERYDGKGYSTGLAGEDIPIEARIICVADAFDAMASSRCYRPKAPMSYIVEEIKRNLGKQFDPEIGAKMLEMIEEGVVPIV